LWHELILQINFHIYQTLRNKTFIYKTIVLYIYLDKYVLIKILDIEFSETHSPAHFYTSYKCNLISLEIVCLFYI
jgi:hypothetical protein